MRISNMFVPCLLDIFVKLNYKLHDYNYFPTVFLSPLRYAIREMANYVLPYWLMKKRNKDIKNYTDVIVSLTSFPARIDNVWKVIRCMKLQTYQPQKILLWLSKEQFPSEDLVPANLKNEIDDIFQIRYVDGDIKSHKKYIYVSLEYPDSPILLIDDDIFYPTDFIEDLVDSFLPNQNIVCKYGYEITRYDDGHLQPYLQWKELPEKKYASNDVFFGSGGGLLFIPASMYKDITNIELATKLTPLADDIWLNAMARLGGLSIVKTKAGLILPVFQNKNNITLFSSNVTGGGNDEQLKLIENYYLKKIGKKVFD